MPTCKTWSRPANFSFLAMELIKELIMASQTRPIPAQKRQRRSSMQYSVPNMTERQLDAYLAARDTIRLIQRTSSLVLSAGTARSNSPRALSDQGCDRARPTTGLLLAQPLFFPCWILTSAERYLQRLRELHYLAVFWTSILKKWLYGLKGGIKVHCFERPDNRVVTRTFEHQVVELL